MKNASISLLTHTDICSPLQRRYHHELMWTFHKRTWDFISSVTAPLGSLTFLYRCAEPPQGSVCVMLHTHGRSSPGHSPKDKN